MATLYLLAGLQGAGKTARARRPWSEEPTEIFAMTETDVDRARAVFQTPDPAELIGGPVPDPPPGS